MMTSQCCNADVVFHEDFGRTIYTCSKCGHQTKPKKTIDII